jgi:hypothetical protein
LLAAIRRSRDGVGDVRGVGLGQRAPGQHPADQQRVPGRSRGSGLDDLGHGHAELAGPQGEEGLVLDLLEPGNGEARPGIPVQQEPARLGEQPGVGRVPAVDGDAEAAGRASSARLGGLVLRHPPDLPRRRVHAHRADAELG